MARNSEKAKSALNRWTDNLRQEMGLATSHGGRKRRPGEATITDAEHFRRSALENLQKLIQKIQDTTLSDAQIRDLNDEINRLLAEKSKWEDVIVELKGPDYKQHAPKYVQEEGKEIAGNPGYKYFGRAKELPGVRELLEEERLVLKPKTRAELLRIIDAEYYGLLDENDEQLLRAEAHKQRLLPKELYEWSKNDIDYSDVVPSQRAIESFLVERKKQFLMQKYAV